MWKTFVVLSRLHVPHVATKPKKGENIGENRRIQSCHRKDIIQGVFSYLILLYFELCFDFILFQKYQIIFKVGNLLTPKKEF